MEVAYPDHQHRAHFYSDHAKSTKEGEANFERKSYVEDGPEQVHRLTLPDLPNEIILYILEHLYDGDLYRLALVDRRLHYLSLPLYLSRKGFGIRPKDQFVTFNYNAQEVLNAVGIALFRPSLTRLHYAIDCWKSHRQLAVETDVLLRALKKLDSLEEMVISFQNTVPPRKPEQMDSSDVYGHLSQLLPTEVYGFPGGLQEPVLASLLAGILSSNCKSVLIRHCGSQNTALRFLGPSLAREFGGMRGLGKRLFQDLRSCSSMLDIDKSHLQNNHIHTFSLHSPMALHPHLVHWTLSALNYSAVTTLSISHQQCTDEHSWALILPCIYIPALVNLSVDLCSMQLHALLYFLRRHVYIQKLYLGRNVLPVTMLSATNIPFSNRILRQLTHLTAPPHWLRYFFSTPGSFPSLSSTTILLRIPTTQGSGFADLDPALEPLIPRFRRMKERRISLSFWSASSNWMAQPLCADSHSPNPTKIDLHNLVTHMELHFALYSLPPSLMTRLPGWLSQFHALTHLSILMLSHNETASAHEKQLLTHAIMASSKINSVNFGIVAETQ